MYLLRRNKIYHMFYEDPSGKLKSKSTKCTRKGDAYKFAIEFLKSLESQQPSTESKTFGEFRDFYKEYSSTRFSKSYQEFIKNAFNQFGRIMDDNTSLKAIKKLDIEKFIQLKLGESGERIINGYLRTLQGSFERAVEFGFIKENIFKTVKKLKPRQNPPVFLTKDEFEKIVEQEKDEQLKVLYTVAVYTGMRMGEIRHLRWEAIDLQKNLIKVNNTEEFTTKSKKSRIIPINPRVKALLISFRKNKTGYLFHKKGIALTKDYISARFKKVVRSLGLNDEIHFHSLRHTFASWLVQAGVSIYEVSKLLGHSDIKVTEIYSHLRAEDLLNSVNRLNN